MDSTLRWTVMPGLQRKTVLASPQQTAKPRAPREVPSLPKRSDDAEKERQSDMPKPGIPMQIPSLDKSLPRLLWMAATGHQSAVHLSGRLKPLCAQLSVMPAMNCMCPGILCKGEMNTGLSEGQKKATKKPVGDMTFNVCVLANSPQKYIKDLNIQTLLLHPIPTHLSLSLSLFLWHQGAKSFASRTCLL